VLPSETSLNGPVAVCEQQAGYSPESDLGGEAGVVWSKDSSGHCVCIHGFGFSLWLGSWAVLFRHVVVFLSVCLLIYRLKIVFLGEDPYFSRAI